MELRRRHVRACVVFRVFIVSVESQIEIGNLVRVQIRSIFKVAGVGGGCARGEAEIIQSLGGEADEDVKTADGDCWPAGGILLCRRPVAVIDDVAGSSLVEVDPARNVTLDISCPTVGANCRGIVESSLDRGAIRLGREVGIGDVDDSGDGMSTSLPSFRSRNGGETLRAAIIHYKATITDYNES